MLSDITDKLFRIKKSKTLGYEIDKVIKTARMLSVYPETHPYLNIFHKKHKSRRPFASNQNVHLMKI
jgi:hypothetical protein